MCGVGVYRSILDVRCTHPTAGWRERHSLMVMQSWECVALWSDVSTINGALNAGSTRGLKRMHFAVIESKFQQLISFPE